MKKDVNPSVIILVLVVSSIGTIAAALDIANYFSSFGQPSIALLNSQGFSQDYPSILTNGTSINLLLSITLPNAISNQYAIAVYVSNASDFSHEAQAPIGKLVAIFGLPKASNVSFPISITIWYKVVHGQKMVYKIVVNGVSLNESIKIDYSLLGVFFQLVKVRGSGYTFTHEWVNLWLNVK